MHDLYLCSFNTDLIEIFIFLVNDGIALEDLNHYINIFDWGQKNKEYKPCKITENQAWALADNILFILRNFVDEGHDIYKFALKMVDILDIVSRSNLSQDDLED